MNKILGWFTGGVVKEVGKVIDGLFTSDEERLNPKTRYLKFFKNNSWNCRSYKQKLY